MGYFREIRNIELSLLKLLTDSLATDWPGVTVVKSFLDAYDKEVPVICARVGEISHYPRELGSTTLFSDCEFVIDVFAKSDGQRLDLADYLVDKLKDGCIYYEHSQTSGNPATLTLTANGRVVCLGFTSSLHLPITEDNLDIHEKYRHYISVMVRKSL